MRLRLSPVVLCNLLLAAAIAAVGWPSALAAFRRLPVEVMAAAVRAGDLPDRADVDDLVQHLSLAKTTSPAAGKDLAFTMLLETTRPDEDMAGRQVRLARAVAEFRDYLCNVPGDSRAWAGLTAALVAQGQRLEAMRALKRSMITAPRWPSLLLWRCQMGLDLFYILDADGRALLEQQFRLETEHSPAAIVNLAVERSAVPVVRSLLEHNPDVLAKFDERLALPRS